MVKMNPLINEIKVQLEWSIIEVMENYPKLTMGEAEHVLEMFYQGRDVLIEQGWRIISSYIGSMREKIS